MTRDSLATVTPEHIEALGRNGELRVFAQKGSAFAIAGRGDIGEGCRRGALHRLRVDRT
jgi:hypothetical protein